MEPAAFPAYSYWPDRSAVKKWSEEVDNKGENLRYGLVSSYAAQHTRLCDLGTIPPILYPHSLRHLLRPGRLLMPLIELLLFFFLLRLGVYASLH